ncbi:MAG: putative murein peptide carboxypeptidase [Bacteroidia bacterium]|nr:putative murein peptide carboxypeptidase [Bacteroidia bacterium]
MTPPYLKPGDKIGIVSTARKISREELQPAVECFEKEGFEIVFGKNLFKELNQFSGTDDERAEDFQLMMNNSEIKAILCARGGYGTVRIIDKLDFTAFRKNPKWVCGFSDVTVLHSHIWQNFGIETIHSIMPVQLKKLGGKSDAAKTLVKSLKGETLDYEFPAHPLNRTGNAEGILLGGNLSILYSLLGSVSDIDTAGKILFIEDIDEYLYHIDRMMMAMKRSGKLDKLKGLIVGGMSDMKDNTIPFGKTVEEIIVDAVKEYGFPVCFNFPAGHIANNYAFYLGKTAKLKVDNTGSSLVF